MNSVSVKSLFRMLSSIGLESLESLTSRNNKSFADSMGGLCSALLELKGEAAAITIAGEVIDHYHAADEEEKLAFFRYLLNELAADPAAVDRAIAQYQRSRAQHDLQALARAVEAPRQDLFRVLNMARAGTPFLADMRADLLRLLRKHPELRPVDHDLLSLFQAWFNRGFLELRRIDWQTPAMVLEKLIEYESVHEIKGWPDLRRRLEADRRCFGFFHPVMPDMPLIFVEVALTRKISSNIHDLLEQPAPEKQLRYNTAIFYSINNCLNGLRGVSFGNFLIKQVIENLLAEMPSVKTCATLSPVPGFMAWLKQNLDSLEFVEDETRQAVKELFASADRRALLQDSAILESELPKLCAWYLLRARSRDKPADPVARFHLGNGARLECINWMADSSDNGLEQSAGIMVNYLYERSTLTRNHELYEQFNEVVCASDVSKMLPKETA